MPFWNGGGALKRPAVTQGCGAAGTTSEGMAATLWRLRSHGGPDPLGAPFPTSPALLWFSSQLLTQLMKKGGQLLSILQTCALGFVKQHRLGLSRRLTHFLEGEKQSCVDEEFAKDAQ